MQIPIPLTIMRGGTSRGLFFMEKDLPPPGPARDRVLLRAFGSPDPKQIDGLGGATSVTSKAAIIGPPSVPGAGVDYTFGQVSITDRLVDWKGNCGNISSAVGPFAIMAGLVRAVDPVTVVRIYNTNTRKLIVAEVPARNGRVVSEGDYRIAGVPGTGARITLDFLNPAGAVTGKLLPTGQARETLHTDAGDYLVSIVDAANPLVFVWADEVGLRGDEKPQEIDADGPLLVRLEAIRSAACERIGLVENRRDATRLSPAVPKMTIVAPPMTYLTASGEEVGVGDINLTARMMSMQKAHRDYAVTGAVCTMVAACVPGTVVAEVMRAPSPNDKPAGELRLGHPGGVIGMEVSVTTAGGEVTVKRAAVARTARRLMQGMAFIPADLWPGYEVC